MTDDGVAEGRAREDGRAAAEDIVAAADTGARNPAGATAKLIYATLLAWALFQLWIASPLPYVFADVLPILSDVHTRPIHLAFAIFLTFLVFPALRSSPRDHVPAQDWVLGAIASLSALYLVAEADGIARRAGLNNTRDLVASGIGILLLLEATRRALGPPLAIVAGVFLAYVFFGHLAPDVIAWKGASFNRAMSQLWLTSEGVFGVAIGVSASMVFLFVTFGSLLEKAGAGAWLIRVAFSLMGHMRGGPAKAAVVSSALTGLISGSSIANVVTTGLVTIPLMRRVGFSAEKAGAVEVASSTNGQLMPPIMGAAAFLMVEYVGIPYIEVIKHAFLPATISYIALIYIVHLEAAKAGMEGMPRRSHSPALQRTLAYALFGLGFVIICGAVYYLLGWLKPVLGDGTIWAAVVLLSAAYLVLKWYSCRVPEPEPLSELTELPEVAPTVKSGLYFLLPIAVLVWCLMIEQLSPGLSVFWAIVAMIAVSLTQRPLDVLFRGTGNAAAAWRRGLCDLVEGLTAGARNMIGIGVATATAGIIVGTVTLTGIGFVMTEFIELISGGNLMLVLLFTAVICIILGLGLPTTANYIVVSALMAPVIVQLGAEAGLIVPLIAVHMFVFYFGILADDTPPVGLAAFAAAAISGGDPIRTGIQGFAYDIRTAVLPFMFIFNTQLLMIGIEGPFHFVVVVLSAVVAILLFAAATQGYFLVRNRLWETAALLLVAFTLFRPGYWMDMVYPPLQAAAPTQIFDIVGNLPPQAQVSIAVRGETLEGRLVEKVVMLPVGPSGSGEERLRETAGLELRTEDGQVLIDAIGFGKPAERQRLDFDWEIVSVLLEAERPPKELLYVPAVLLLAAVVLLQRRRRTAPAAA